MLQPVESYPPLEQVWEDYAPDNIVRVFVHHAQVAVVIYGCKGDGEFVREHKGLSFGVQMVCRPYLLWQDLFGATGDNRYERRSS